MSIEPGAFGCPALFFWFKFFIFAGIEKINKRIAWVILLNLAM